MPFRTPLIVQSLNAHYWRLVHDLVYVGSKGDRIVVPHGSRTDFASVPRWLGSFMQATGAWTKAAVVHDHLCDGLNYRYKRWEVDEPAINAVDTDGIFRVIMREGGVGPVRRWVAWTAVRWAALFNPARRAGWWSTAHLVLPISAATLAATLAAVAGVLAAITWIIPW